MTRRRTIAALALALTVFAGAIATFIDTEDHVVDTSLQDGETPRISDSKVVAPSSSITNAESIRESVALPSESDIATIVLQVDEIDRCIDPAGTTLTLRERRTGSTHASTITKDGGTLFESVPIAPSGSEFDILTGVADRRCFPPSFTVRPAELEGDPRSFALSVSLIHDHALEGVVVDAATRAPIPDATVEVDSFAVSSARCDSEGRYRLALPEPRGSLVVRAPGYQETWWSFPESRSDGSTWLPSQRDFELVRDPLLSIVEVEAVHADGSPAAFARLTVQEGSDVAYASALRGFASVAQRDRYLDRIASELDAIGRVTTPDGAAPTQLDEEGRATIRFALPCATRLRATAREQAAEESLVLEPGGRVRVQLHLAPAAVLDVGIANGPESFAGRALVFENGGPRASGDLVSGGSRLEFADLPQDTELTVIVDGSATVDGASRRLRALARVRTGADSTPRRVDLVLGPEPAPATFPTYEEDAPRGSPSGLDLLVRVVSADGGESPERVSLAVRDGDQVTVREVERDAFGSLEARLDSIASQSFVSASRGLLGDGSVVESNVLTLGMKPLRRIRILAVDRLTGVPVDASASGVTSPRFGGAQRDVLVACGQITTIVVRAPGYATASIPVGDGDGIPWLRVLLDR